MPVSVSKNEQNDDKESWQALQDGQQEAVAQLFEKYYQRLFNYGTRIAPSRKELVRDSIQVLFFKLWKYRHTIEEAESVQAYLLSSLRRTVLDKLNQEKARSHRSYKYLDIQVTVVPNSQKNIIGLESTSHLKKRLKQACQELSSRQREILLLRYDHGLTNREISEVLDINYQTVRNHLSRAIGNMRDQLTETIAVET